MRCEEVREMLPAYVRDGEVSLSFRRHLAGCAECKAELVDYQSLMSGLAGLQAETFETSPQLVAALQAIPTQGRVEILRRHVTRNRAAYVGAAALAAGAVGAAVWRSTRRTATA